MKGWIIVLAASACTANGDTANGSRAYCAEGGALTEPCTPVVTAEDACWKLVSCGAIPVSSDKNDVFTWGRCVDYLEGRDTDSEGLAIHCIAAATCDALKVDGSPLRPNTDQMACLLLGGQ